MTPSLFKSIFSAVLLKEIFSALSRVEEVSLVVRVSRRYLLLFVCLTLLCSLVAGGEPQTDKAAIDEAEKKVGPKKDE